MLYDARHLFNSVTGWGRFWSLDPTVTFLNHGSFGACPLPVLAAQQRLRAQLEGEPLRFFMREFEQLLDEARSQLATFVGVEPDDLVFVPNATTGVNTVLRSLQFESDDELLTTNHEYNACRNALDFVSARTGGQVVVAKIPFPINSPEQVVEAVLERVSPRTRLALLDHVTSQTGLIFPIKVGSATGSAWRRYAYRRCPCTWNGAAQFARDRGDLLHRQLPQVVVRA